MGTGKGIPDINSITEYQWQSYWQEKIISNNASGNSERQHVCPICAMWSVSGSCMYSCCGVSLPVHKQRKMKEHSIKVDLIENEYYVTMEHSMSKSIIYLSSRMQPRYVKWLAVPDRDSGKIFRKGHGNIYVYCNRHGLKRVVVKETKYFTEWLLRC